MSSSLLTADGSGQAYSEKFFSVGSSGGIFRGSGASAHTMPDSLGAITALTLLLQRLYTLKYIISDRINQRITKAGTIYYVTLY
jgi:hypothetical protein